MKTTKAMTKCAKWLSLCLKLGWRKESLDLLESLWWEHHDDKGNVKEPK